MIKYARFLAIICAMICPLAIGEVRDASKSPKAPRFLPGTNLEFSWLKSEDRSNFLKKYSYAYWINGCNKFKVENSKNLLCFETGYYGVIFDMASLDKPQFSVMNDDSNLMSSLESGTSRVATLDPAELIIEVEQGGKKYRVKSCSAGVTDRVGKFLQGTMTIDAGQFVQRYLIKQLYLFDESNTPLECVGSLELIAWPDSLTFIVEIAPDSPATIKKAPVASANLKQLTPTPATIEKNPTATVWNNATLSITLKTKNNSWTNKTVVKEDWKEKVKKKLVLNCNIQSESPQRSDLEMKFSMTETMAANVTLGVNALSTYPGNFEPEFNAYVIRIPKLKRDSSYSKHGGYDDYYFEINNNSSKMLAVPFHLIMTEPRSGTCAQNILCYLDGTPTGINLQGAGSTDLKARTVMNPYMVIPAKPGKTVLLYRIAYKYYGTVATAYGHQDCVVNDGYGRWWQFAIGGAGETMTMDGDHGPTNQSICDVRALYIRKGLKGVTSNWTDAGWGGDWLTVYDEHKNKLTYNDMKTVALATGPCFTDLRFKGYYGNDRSVAVDSRVSTLRTDDYVRMFFDIRYDFLKTISANNTSFFMTGSTVGVPKLAYGNLQGIIKEVSGANMAKELKLLNNVTVDGPGPWWVSTPENHRIRKDGTEKRPMGSTSLIFRSVDYNFGGKSTTVPNLRIQPAGTSGVFDGDKPALGAHTYLVAPAEISEFKARDSVHICVEWVTPPRIADDYYGPNKAFHQWLQENPKSWKTVFREAKGNNLNVKVTGGRLIKNYPLIIKAESANEILFDIEGGVGYVPLRFDGLTSDRGYSLYQVINNAEVALDQSSYRGNDFWQTIYDASSNSYNISYNICLDGYPTSKWVLKYKKP